MTRQLHNLILPAFLVSLLLAPGWVGSQIVDFREMSRRQDDLGVSRGEYTFTGPFRTSQTSFAEVNLASPEISIQFLTPLEGINTGYALERLGRRVDGNTAIAFDPLPSFGQEFALKGLRISEGRIHSWPGQGPHLLFRPEGGVDLHLPEPDTGTISFDDGTTIPLVSINGALPRPGRDEAALYTGILNAGSLPVTEWPADTMALVLSTRLIGTDINRLLFSGHEEEMPFRGGRFLERNLIRTSSSEGVLLFSPPLSEQLSERLRSNPRLNITIGLDQRVQQAAAVVPAGNWIVRGGEIVGEPNELKFLQNALAVDLVRRRLLLMAPLEDSRGGAGIPIDQFARFLADEGYQHGFELGGRVPSLLSPLDGSSHARRAGRIQTRMAMVVAPAPPTMKVPDVDGDLFRITGVTVEGTRAEFLLNSPGRLVDERVAFSPSLEHFWAARLPQLSGWHPAGREPGPVAIRFIMPRTIPIRAMELVHAEIAGFSPEFNLKGYRVWGRDRSQDPWVLLADIRHENPIDRERLVFTGPSRISEIRLEILEPNFMAGGDTARLAEVFFWGPERVMQP